MLAIDLITDEIPPLKTSDTGEKALLWMEEFKVNELPIVNHNEFLGLVTENDILDANTPKEALGNHELSIDKPMVYAHEHIYAVIGKVSELKLSLIPVLDAQNNYLGTITLSKLIDRISHIAAIDEPGGIVELELNSNDYSMIEIANIIESNDAKILSSYITQVPDSTKLEVTIKTNQEDLSGILQTFNRYQYTIVASFHKSSADDELRQRYDAFMHYLNI